MWSATNNLPLGLGGDGGILWPALGASLPPAFCGVLATPIGVGAAAGPPAGAVEGGMIGRTIRGRARLGTADGEWWTAVCADEAHPENPDWPRTIEMTVGGAQFLLTTNAIKHMAERMPAKRRTRARSTDLVWKWGATSGGSGADFPLSSLAGSLEKLAARLPGKPRKHHQGLRVDDWEIGVTTESTPWRVTHAVYKPDA